MLVSRAPLRSPIVSPQSVCSQCRARLLRLRREGVRRLHASAVVRPAEPSKHPRSRGAYFSANSIVDASGSNVYAPPWSVFFTSSLARRSTASAAASSSLNPAPTSSYPPRDSGEPLRETPTPHDRHNKPPASPAELALPPDAPSRLTHLSSASPPHSLRRAALAYLALAKPRLSVLVVLTAATAYALYPTPPLLLDLPSAASPSSAVTLAWLAGGTFLTAAAANALNMRAEPATDAQMSRTRTRPLVRGLISPRGALVFAGATGALGVGALAAGANATVAALGAFNIALYAGAYTPLKRVSVANTWVGAVVGAVPPLMGWAAAAGEAQPRLPSTVASTFAGAPATQSGGAGDGVLAALSAFYDGSAALLLGPDAAGGWLLAALLFAWQFPHFNALAHPLRHEYQRAGLRMLAWTNPRANARVALRYAVLLSPVCVGLWAPAGVVSGWFVVASAPLNGWIAWEAWRFWRGQRSGGEGGKQAGKGARGLFWASVWYLPGVLCMAMACKKGLWERIWRGVVDEDEEELD